MSAPAIGVRPRWAPGVNPTIDWSHPLAHGLRYCLFANGARVVDLVSGRVLTNQANAATGSAPSGSGLASSGLTSGAYLPITTAPTYPLSFTHVGLLRSGVTGTGILCFAYGASNGWVTENNPFLFGLAAPSAAGNAELYRVDNVTLLAAMTASITTCNTVTGVIASGSQQLYTDGVQRATASASLANPTSTLLSGLGFNAYTNSTTASSAATGKLGLVHGRALSAAEVAALHADPFQIFRQ